MIGEKNRIYGKTKYVSIDTLKTLFRDKRLNFISVALLFGSRVDGSYHDRSDYDFALLMDDSKCDGWGVKAHAYFVLGEVLGLDDSDYDIVDLKVADEAILSTIKESHIILKGTKDEVSKILG